jgi:hypothetical protein
MVKKRNRRDKRTVNSNQTSDSGSGRDIRRSISRAQLAIRWEVSIDSLKRFEKRGVLSPIKIAPRVLRYWLDDIERIEAEGLQNRREGIAE